MSSSCPPERKDREHLRADDSTHKDTTQHARRGVSGKTFHDTEKIKLINATHFPTGLSYWQPSNKKQAQKQKLGVFLTLFVKEDAV